MEQFPECGMNWVVNPFFFKEYMTLDELSDLGYIPDWFYPAVLQQMIF